MKILSPKARVQSLLGTADPAVVEVVVTSTDWTIGSIKISDEAARQLHVGQPVRLMLVDAEAS